MARQNTQNGKKCCDSHSPFKKDGSQRVQFPLLHQGTLARQVYTTQGAPGEVSMVTVPPSTGWGHVFGPCMGFSDLANGIWALTLVPKRASNHSKRG